MNRKLIAELPKAPWNENDNVIWLASRLKLYRNVEKFSFPNKLSIEQRKQILEVVSQQLEKAPGLDQPRLIIAEEVDPLEKEYLFEHFLATESFHQAHTGEAFVIDKSGTFLAVINVRNHLQLMLVDQRGEIERAWAQIAKVETAIGEAMNYAFSPEFGFLTSDPTTCGTALVGYVFLHVPALIHTSELLHRLHQHADENIVTSGIQGDPENLVGDVLAIHNHYTLGVTEENIISALRSFSTQIMLEEKSARNRIREENSPLIKDEVSRAYGLLSHSFQLETLETMRALSLLKLGVDLDWISGIAVRDLNRLFFNTRRANLIAQLGDEVEAEHLPHCRAKIIHKALKSVKLKV